MQELHEPQEWNATVINAVHCAIAATDALSIWKLGIRHAGERHDDAVRILLDTYPQDINIRNSAKHLQSLLSMKSDSEYGERLMNERNAALAKRDAERLFIFVESRIPR